MASSKPPQIVLTQLEQQVFSALLDTVSHFNLGTTLRAAGGWVRDKVLGKASDDIDIAVDNMSGEEFALKVIEHMTQSSAANAVSNVGVVKQNPDQSKHLATACFRLYGLSLDVNNLRTETYTQESRIPVTTLGTPVEDAQRRDFTVNALFYNISTDSVEDLTCRGLTDLAEGIIRTPLPARETFRDDPLRMLRALRFAARFGFRLDEEILLACMEQEMQQLLESKVSRERFGIEVDKMMKASGLRPVAALQSMRQLGLLGSIFISQEALDALPPGQGLDAGELAAGVDLAEAAAGILLEEAPEQELRLAMYAGLLLCWREREALEKKKRRPLLPLLLRAALKIDGLACEATQDLACAAAALAPLAPLALAAPGEVPVTTAEAEAEQGQRLRVGLQLRLAGERWPAALALAVALAGVRGAAAQEAFRERAAWISSAGLLGCWQWKPLFDGRRLMAPPFSVPKGPRLGEVMEAQLHWRLEYPQLTEEDCTLRVQALVKSWLPK